MAVKCIIRKMDGLEERKASLYPEVVSAHTINEDQFVEMVCRNRNLEPGHVKAVLAGVSETAGSLLSLGHRVRIDGIGSLSLCVKGRLEPDKRGVIQLKDAALKTVKIIPSKKLVEMAGECSFSLLSHEVKTRATADKDAATAAVGALLEEKPFFVSSEFEKEAGVSRGLAKKMLTQLEEDGVVKKSRRGRYNIWIKGGEE